MKTLLRVEHPEGIGLWYNSTGQFHGMIHGLEMGASGLDMDFDEHFVSGGNWFSGVKDVEMLRMWFPGDDLQLLFKHGYNLYEFEVVDYKIANGHPVFLREGLTGKPVTLEEIGF